MDKYFMTNKNKNLRALFEISLINLKLIEILNL